MSKRYIDADELIECFDGYPDYVEFDVEDIESIINEQDVADVVEVVRCKDCRWYERDIFDREAGVCFNPNKCTKTLGFEVQNEDYCSYGERAEE